MYGRLKDAQFAQLNVPYKIPVIRYPVNQDLGFLESYVLPYSA